MFAVLDKLAFYTGLILVAAIAIKIVFTVLTYNSIETEVVPDDVHNVKYYRVSVTNARSGAVLLQNSFYAASEDQAKKKFKKARKNAIRELVAAGMAGEMDIKAEVISQEEYQEILKMLG